VFTIPLFSQHRKPDPANPYRIYACAIVFENSA
jgi:hypothetical protein